MVNKKGIDITLTGVTLSDERKTSDVSMYLSDIKLLRDKETRYTYVDKLLDAFFSNLDRKD
jgi:hypothetical protein